MREIGSWVHVRDKMQSGYSYRIDAFAGKDFAPSFNPRFSPKEMLVLGVFEGKYLNCTSSGYVGQVGCLN